MCRTCAHNMHRRCIWRRSRLPRRLASLVMVALLVATSSGERRQRTGDICEFQVCTNRPTLTSLGRGALGMLVMHKHTVIIG